MFKKAASPREQFTRNFSQNPPSTLIPTFITPKPADGMNIGTDCLYHISMVWMDEPVAINADRPVVKFSVLPVEFSFQATCHELYVWQPSRFSALLERLP